MIEAEIVNVSKGGMSVECWEELQEGKVYTVRIFWKGAVFNARCEAIWTLDGGSGRRHRSGLKFVEMNEADDFVACLEEYMVDTGRRHHPRMSMKGPRALLMCP
jgi:hypothetical protein